MKNSYCSYAALPLLLAGNVHRTRVSTTNCDQVGPSGQACWLRNVATTRRMRHFYSMKSFSPKLRIRFGVAVDVAAATAAVAVVVSGNIIIGACCSLVGRQSDRQQNKNKKPFTNRATSCQRDNQTNAVPFPLCPLPSSSFPLASSTYSYCLTVAGTSNPTSIVCRA